MSNHSDLPPTPCDEFVKIVSENQKRIFLYILSQVGRPPDAEEILQDTNLVILRKFHQFTVGTNFVAWAFQIANYEVLRFRQRRRSSRVTFSDDLNSAIARDVDEHQDELEDRRAALRECIKSLRPQDRELIDSRYMPGRNAKELAAELGRPANSVYQSFSRIRKWLFDCVNRRINSGTK